MANMIIVTCCESYLYLILICTVVLGKGPLGAHQNIECFDNNDNQPNVVMQSVVLGKKRIRPTSFPDDVEDYLPPDATVMRFAPPRNKRRSAVEPDEDVDNKFDKILRAIENMKMRRKLRDDAEWVANSESRRRERNWRRHANSGEDDQEAEGECFKYRSASDAERLNDWNESVEREQSPRRSFLRRLECSEDQEQDVVPEPPSRYNGRRRPRKFSGDREALYEGYHRSRNRKPVQDVLYIPNFEREPTYSQHKKKRRTKDWR